MGGGVLNDACKALAPGAKPGQRLLANSRPARPAGRAASSFTSKGAVRDPRALAPPSLARASSALLEPLDSYPVLDPIARMNDHVVARRETRHHFDLGIAAVCDDHRQQARPIAFD